MPKFGRMWFNGYCFGENVPVYGYFGKSIKRIPLGMTVRKQLGKRVIFQIVRGNGYYGSIQGKAYQTIKKYFVPSSINNAQGQTARDALTTAVSNWKIVLTQTQKDEYNRRAAIKRFLSGYNLYVGEYVKANA